MTPQPLDTSRASLVGAKRRLRGCVFDISSHMQQDLKKKLHALKKTHLGLEVKGGHPRVPKHDDATREFVIAVNTYMVSRL